MERQNHGRGEKVGAMHEMENACDGNAAQDREITVGIDPGICSFFLLEDNRFRGLMA